MYMHVHRFNSKKLSEEWAASSLHYICFIIVKALPSDGEEQAIQLSEQTESTVSEISEDSQSTDKQSVTGRHTQSCT